MHVAVFRIALLITLLAASARDVTAQEPIPARDSLRVAPRQWIAGVSIGVPGFGGEPFPTLLTVGGHWTQLNIGRLGADFSVGIVPRTLIDGIIAVGARGGVALPLAVSPRMLLLPSAGVSGVGAVGSGGALGVKGFNTGLTAVLMAPDGTGVRSGITWHRFNDAREALWLLELGVVRGPRTPR